MDDSIQKGLRIVAKMDKMVAKMDNSGQKGC